jgi:hypothetical protein
MPPTWTGVGVGVDLSAHVPRHQAESSHDPLIQTLPMGAGVHIISSDHVSAHQAESDQDPEAQTLPMGAALQGMLRRTPWSSGTVARQGGIVDRLDVDIQLVRNGKSQLICFGFDRGDF